MIPALALSLAVRATIDWRRDSLVSFDVDKGRNVFPGIRVEPVTDPQWQAWARPAISKALARYPLPSLVDRLEGVYVVWDLSYQGTLMGATNDGIRRIVVEVGTKGINATSVERMMHHEFAHALKNRPGSGFPTDAWQQANAPSFAYGSGGFDAVKAGRINEKFDPKLAEQGVLSEYGASSIEEDWATFGQAIMVNDPGFWLYAVRYPRIGEKARIALDFYRRTFPGIRLRDYSVYRSQ